ncbi:MAG: AAA family ATPase [Spirochaetales bacterium]|nr:AAA family ATPase [Spirochaetales bacterium]
MNSAIHIFGASGSGTTTLGKALSLRLGYTHFDTDEYYWEKKYTKSRSPEQRITMIRRDITALAGSGWVLSGHLAGWGDPLVTLFGLVIFLWVPQEVRLERLLVREKERYGNRILEGGDHHAHHLEFMEWAACYDTGGMDIRSRQKQEAWMEKLPCPLLRLEGDFSTEERLDKILSVIA